VAQIVQTDPLAILAVQTRSFARDVQRAQRVTARLRLPVRGAF
jgi:hypothetical protein